MNYATHNITFCNIPLRKNIIYNDRKHIIQTLADTQETTFVQTDDTQSRTGWNSRHTPA